MSAKARPQFFDEYHTFYFAFSQVGGEGEGLTSDLT